MLFDVVARSFNSIFCDMRPVAIQHPEECNQVLYVNISKEALTTIVTMNDTQVLRIIGRAGCMDSLVMLQSTAEMVSQRGLPDFYVISICDSSIQYRVVVEQ